MIYDSKMMKSSPLSFAFPQLPAGSPSAALRAASFTAASVS
jgi:hypothetical protein